MTRKENNTRQSRDSIWEFVNVTVYEDEASMRLN